MSLKFDFSNMMSDVVGTEGIFKEDFLCCADRAKKAHKIVEDGRGKGMQEWMLCPYNQNEVVTKIVATAEKIQNSCESFVVLGIGGSALGPTAVFSALKHTFYNELPKSVRKTPKFYVLDNVDPERINALFDVIDVSKTVFNVITKSGSTSETMSQFLIVWDILTKQLGDKAREHVIATTSEFSGNLIKLSKEYGFETFFIPSGVGGRFSELSPVGLLPAAVVGIDIAEMLRGAREMDEKCKSDDLLKNPALASAVLLNEFFAHGKNIHVMMPYADSLKFVADWYSQLWAESLGKEMDNDGNVVNCGQTPVKALGVTDQHSQVQLYNEGPFDKVITFLEVENFRSDVAIPKLCQDYPGVKFLGGHTLSELMNKELFATRYNLTLRGRVNFTIVLDQVNAYNIGALLFALQLQTAYAGALLNINTYNQPGVEGGKNATYALFGREGYENVAREIECNTKHIEKFIIE